MMHKVRCECGSREVVNQIGRVFSGYYIYEYRPSEKADYTFAEIRCFYCRKLIEAYGVKE